MSNDYLRDVSILVVDDQEFIRMLVREMLRALGAAQIFDASNGEDAWAFLQSRSVDLLITDWYMEPVDGLTLTRRIRHDPKSTNPYLPVIMISGFAEAPRIVQARDAGVNEFVVKPLSPKALFSRIQNVIENPRQFVRTKDFFGPDRRRKSEAVKTDNRAAPPTDQDPNRQMSQDDVNAFLHPDEEPLAS